jgi:hypothetical protein
MKFTDHSGRIVDRAEPQFLVEVQRPEPVRDAATRIIRTTTAFVVSGQSSKSPRAGCQRRRGRRVAWRNSAPGRPAGPARVSRTAGACPYRRWIAGSDARPGRRTGAAIRRAADAARDDAKP